MYLETNRGTWFISNYPTELTQEQKKELKELLEMPSFKKESIYRILDIPSSEWFFILDFEEKSISFFKKNS